MRISDWSSDVCSSDLKCTRCDRYPRGDIGIPPFCSRSTRGAVRCQLGGHLSVLEISFSSPAAFRVSTTATTDMPGTSRRRTLGEAIIAIRTRSEEHTSELQSLMRISYAVFCLKKKKQKKRSST